MNSSDTRRRWTGIGPAESCEEGVGESDHDATGIGIGAGTSDEAFETCIYGTQPPIVATWGILSRLPATFRRRGPRVGTAAPTDFPDPTAHPPPTASVDPQTADRLLSGIEAIDWSALEHAYGPATTTRFLGPGSRHEEARPEFRSDLKLRSGTAYRIRTGDLRLERAVS